MNPVEIFGLAYLAIMLIAACVPSWRDGYYAEQYHKERRHGRP